MSTSPSESSRPSKIAPSTANGNLIGLLTAGFYVLFTLLPSSHSLMVSWPWVAVWQVALALPVIWLLWQLWFKPLGHFSLGSGLDWPMAILVFGLVISTLFAEFPNQARWYSWAALGGIAAVYALSGWLKTSNQALKLLKFQALLGIAFILFSLGLWISQTYLPELQRLAELEPYGVSQQFDFGVTSLRNWYPIGHQNYVAGYLVLILPLLLGLGIADRGWQRWLWSGGVCLGLLDLYTASSRGGLLALVVTVAIALTIALFRSQLPRRIIVPVGSLGLCLLLTITFGNSRVRQPLLALLQGRTNNSELGYRIITNTIGWHMGLDHPLTGIGPGNVFQLYQKYRPYWAGREAELHFQLHSTPAQLWAELGIWGISALLSITALLIGLTWRWSNYRSVQPALDSALVWSLVASLFAFGLMGLTDYQLDVVAISGVLTVYLAVLAQVYQQNLRINNRNTSASHPEKKLRFSRLAVGAGIGLCIIASLWLVPIHRAWAISKQGFDQLNRGNFDGFETALVQAHRLVSWEPYYPSILAWALGDFSYQTTGDSSQALRTAATKWFETANTVAPYQEFGRSNLGWLLSQESPEKSVVSFTQAAQLVPAKQGVFLGLGLALLRNEKPELAVDALTLELLRFPLTITSHIWQLGELATVKEKVFSKLARQYSDLIQSSDTSLKDYVSQRQGALHWWQGDYLAAAKSWKNFSTGQTLLKLVQSNKLDAALFPQDAMGRQVVLAWLLPEQRRELIEKALIDTKNDLLQFNAAFPEVSKVEQWVTTMEQAKSFDDWLKNSGLIEQPRRQRVGFGTLYRHIDGPLPLDYFPNIVNQAVANSIGEVFPAPSLFPDLEQVLQPKREKNFSQINQ